MGGFFSKLLDKLTGIKEVRLLMLGLDNAGKTTILYKLKFNQTVTTVPTVGFNVESLMLKNVKFNVWVPTTLDVGGQDKIRPLWRHYYVGTKALVFVVDSQDLARIDEARLELHRIMNDRVMKDCFLLVFANKMDLPQALSKEEMIQKLDLEKMKPGSWHLEQSCATSGDGLIDGFNWLVNTIRNPPPQ